MRQDAHSPLRLGVLEDFLGLHLRIAYERSWQDFAARLGDDAMRPGYFTMITLIALNPGINQTEISRAAARDKSSVTKALRWMEDEGLITRDRLDADRRAHSVRVTEAGRARQARLEAAARDHLVLLQQAIGEDRSRLFLEILNDVIDKLPDRAAP